MDGGYEFRGIPYAVPPTDDLYPLALNKTSNYKWEPATSPFRHEHCWRDILPYPKLKPNECLQIRNMTNEKYDVVGSEDCLTLDIFTPFIGYDTPSPVVVVIAVPTLFGGWIDQNHAGNLNIESRISVSSQCYPFLITQILLCLPLHWQRRRALFLLFRDSVSDHLVSCHDYF